MLPVRGTCTSAVVMSPATLGQLATMSGVFAADSEFYLQGTGFRCQGAERGLFFGTTEDTENTEKRLNIRCIPCIQWLYL